MLASAKFQSTHSITECDWLWLNPLYFPANFNPRTPLQSATLPNSKLKVVPFISIHALHYRVRPGDPIYRLTVRDISIHALHYRVRQQKGTKNSVLVKFQSTHSITECDNNLDQLNKHSTISIHALHYRVRRDPQTWCIYDRPISIHALHYRVRPQHIVVYSAILLVAAKNFCAIQVQ